MKPYLPFLVLLNFLLACLSAPTANSKGNTSLKDSITDASNNHQIKGTVAAIEVSIRNKQVIRDDANDDENPGGNLNDLYNDYISYYTRPCMLDSSFVLGTDIFHLQYKHICLMDSAITLPRKYVSLYKLDSFVTHNFITQVRLEKNDKIILQKTVYKKDFNSLIDSSLKEFATLRYPFLRVGDSSITLDYSISIPLTDVGMGVRMVIDGKGKVLYVRD